MFDWLIYGKRVKELLLWSDENYKHNLQAKFVGIKFYITIL